MRRKDDPLFGMTAKERKLRFRGKFTPTGNSPNRLERRAHFAGKNPRTHKGGMNWRRKAWKIGNPYPGRRYSGVVDPAAVVRDDHGRLLAIRPTQLGVVALTAWRKRSRARKRAA
jgi:hypothetical protein